jgi:hypothetical protein
VASIDERVSLLSESFILTARCSFRHAPAGRVAIVAVNIDQFEIPLVHESARVSSAHTSNTTLGPGGDITSTSRQSVPSITL